MELEIIMSVNSLLNYFMPKVTKILPQQQHITLGCDPEFFFTKGGKVIGSEKIITDKKGIEAGMIYEHEKGKPFVPNNKGLTVIDGVQAELHPAADTCRDRLANNIISCLTGVEHSMVGEVKADFSQVVEVSKDELDTLADENKKFGCSESMNTHKKGKNKVTQIKADPMKYLKRSAGGHIHMGATPKLSPRVPTGKTIEEKDMLSGEMYKRPEMKYELYDNPQFLALKNPDVLVPVLDIILGNTCVMIDRNPANAERRKNYGKAGEYRLPTYGLEYRTLSNFWLRGRPLFSLVFGLARQAVNMVVYDNQTGHVEHLMSLVDMADITKAINENDMDLAVKNWNKIEKFMLDITDDKNSYGHYPITNYTIKGFHKLIDNGIDHYFKQDPLDAWLRPNEKAGLHLGFTQWAMRVPMQ